MWHSDSRVVVAELEVPALGIEARSQLDAAGDDERVGYDDPMQARGDDLSTGPDLADHIEGTLLRADDEWFELFEAMFKPVVTPVGYQAEIELLVRVRKLVREQPRIA